jgi:Flp pilus assembly protein TadD
MAREAIARHQWQLAFQSADALCRQAPHDFESFVLRGTVYREQKLVREAQADFAEAVRLAPKSPIAHSALAMLLDEQGSGDDALNHHKRAVELDPRNPNLLNNLGFSLFARGRARDAIPFFHEALRAAPTDARIRNNLGFAYATTGDFTRAAEHFRVAGRPADASNNLGFAYERRGDLKQAFDLYCEAVRLDPAAVAPRSNLSRVAELLERPLPGDLQATPGT